MSEDLVGKSAEAKDFKAAPKFYDQETEDDLTDDKPGIDRRTFLAGLAGFGLANATRAGGEYLAKASENAKSEILTNESVKTIDDYTQAVIDMALAEGLAAKKSGKEPGEYSLAVLNEFKRKLEEKIKDPKPGDKAVHLNTDYLDEAPKSVPMPELKDNNESDPNGNIFY